MSHICECYYKSKVEKTIKDGTTVTHICTYELKDGGYVVFKDVRQLNGEKADYYDFKITESYAKASDEMPDDMIAEQKSQNLKRLAEIAKKLI